MPIPLIYTGGGGSLDSGGGLSLADGGGGGGSLDSGGGLSLADGGGGAWTREGV